MTQLVSSQTREASSAEARREPSRQTRLTPSQREAVTTQAPRTLVSAAAGSGKTSVLTQRIVALVCGSPLDDAYDPNAPQVDPERMTDIDSVLVMTFTRSAAAEMRRRIIDKLNEAAAGVAATDERAARLLYDQAERAAGADISTVHSFCQHLLADYYERAGIAPRTSVLNETQQDHVMAETLKQLFADIYAADSEEDGPEWTALRRDLLSLLHKYTKNGDDTVLARDVLDTYRKMMGLPDWDAWLGLSQRPGQAEKVLQDWADGWLEDLRLLKQELDDATELLELVGDDRKLAANRKLQAALGKAVAVLGTTHDVWLARAEIPDRPGLARFSSAKDGDPTGATAAIASYHKHISDTLKRLREECADDREEAFRKMEAAHEDARILASLARKFEKRYSERKRALSKIDFDDMEHLALKVLRSLKEDGEPLRKRYTHIFVDEYQDTNPVQEEILRTLQALQPNAHVFMVGDLKQSIYAFRAADSRIFRDKDRELSGSELDQAIYMNDNFRSAPAVIEAVNAIMGCVMTEGLGGVEYDSHQALRCGREHQDPGTAEILLAEKHGADTAFDLGASPSEEVPEELSPEAEMIARKVEELAREGIAHGDPGASPYGKIAVLSRTRSSKAYMDLPAAFDARGIPYWLDEDKYQSFSELDLFLNLLELTVNDRRDVPLVSVLRSYMYKMDEADFGRVSDWYYTRKAMEAEDWDAGGPEEDTAAEEMRSRQLVARAASMRVPFFQQLGAFHSAISSGEEVPTVLEKGTFEKADRFFRDLEELRVRGTDMALGKFVDEVAQRYDFGGYLLTRPNGANRRHAFDVLLQTIRDQALVSGNSLYRVLDAVRRGRRSQPATATADSVRIMSVHRSKGLEYPVVFVADLNRSFNMRDSQGAPLLDTDYGIVMDCVDEAAHTKATTLEHCVAQRHIAAASMSEELRALYVAMTRAQEQLYLCGTADPDKGDRERWRQLPGQYRNARSMLDWVMGAVSELREKRCLPEGLFDGERSWHSVTASAAGQSEALERRDTGLDGALELVKASKAEPEAPLLSLPDKKRVPAVRTVSKVVAAESATEGRPWYRTMATREVPAADPEATAGTALDGAERGTALHEALQYAVRENRKRLHPASGDPKDPLDGREAIRQMARARLLPADVAKELEASASSLDAFLGSELCGRVMRSPRVLLEQPFTLLMSETDEAGEDSAQKIRLQGRIDLAFEEEDGWILVDYKSDRTATVKELRQMYGRQMGYYKKALETALGGRQKVRECHLFSLRMKKSIRLGPNDLAVPDRLEG